MSRKTKRVFLAAVATAALLSVLTNACNSDSEGKGDAGDGGSADATVMPEVQGCAAEVKLYQTPADPAARGPWPVGVRTVKIDTLKVEIWYPAAPGSERGNQQVTYDLRQWLPPVEKKKIPDEAAPVQACGCRRDLPIDAAHGKYPVIVFIHGTAGFRTQSLAHMEHWASRGFVVAAADYPGLYLRDMLDFNIASDLPGDTQRILDALGTPAEDLAFLEGHIDMTRVGMSGHSAGGMAIKGFGSLPGVRVLVPMAAGGTTPSSSIITTLVMGGQNDKVVAYSNQQKGYADSAPPKRLLGIGNTGHLFPTDLCWTRNSAGENLVETAIKYEISNASLATGLFDCPGGQLTQDITRDIVNHATTAALEEVLTCKTIKPFEGIQAKYPDIVEFIEQL